MTVNRRSQARHEVAIAVTLNVVVPGGAKEVVPEATIENLCLGGAFVVVPRRMTIGTRLSLGFRIPTHGLAIETDATVRWSNDRGIGVRFDGLRAAEVWALGKFFEGLEPASSP